MHSPNVLFFFFSVSGGSVWCQALQIVNSMELETMEVPTRPLGVCGDDSGEVGLLDSFMVAALTIKSAI